MRSVINMKNTVMKISMTNRQQVGEVLCVHVLSLLPLSLSLSRALSRALARSLSIALALALALSLSLAVSLTLGFLLLCRSHSHSPPQVMIPDVQKLINQSGNVSSDIFNTRLMKPPTSVLVFPLKVKQHIFGVVFCMSGVQTDFSDVSPRLRELCEVMSPYLLNTLSSGHLESEYLEVQEAVPDANGSMSGMSFSKMSDAYNVGSSSVGGGSVSCGDHFAFNQSRSSTGALVTGLTEKLNQKRIKSAMDFSAGNQLADLQIQHLLGEGGFAKVFRGLWQGLVVGIKIVVDDGKNEKMVMKNAHEIAILSTLSHPHVTQAYLCLTDVLVRDLMSTCVRAPHASVLASPAYAYLVSMEVRYHP
jgi:hypothetical protein